MIKTLRLILLVCIMGVAAWSGWQVYGFVFELLDFQIGAYKLMLQTGEQFGDIKDSFGGLVEQALGLFGDSGLENNLGALGDQQRLDIEEKLDSFEKKLRIISSIVGILVGYIVWKLLFDIVFGLSNVYKKITSFIS